MEDKKNNVGLIAVIIILVVIVIGLGCSLGYVLLKDNNNESSNNKTENLNVEQNVEKENDVVGVTDYNPKCIASDMPSSYKTDVDVEKYDNIYDYIQNQDNVSVKLTACAGEVLNSEGIHEDFKMNDYTLNSDEVNKFFNEMKQSNITIKESTLGGVCISSVTISYNRNGINHQLKTYSIYSINSSTDGNIYEILDKNINATNVEYCSYMIDNFSVSVKNKLDEMTKPEWRLN